MSFMRTPLLDEANMGAMALPKDHAERMQRALLSLDGLSVGDAFGDRFFGSSTCEQWIEQRQAPPGRWAFTDDTAMALSIVRCLKQFGRIEQDALASTFAQ